MAAEAGTERFKKEGSGECQDGTTTRKLEGNYSTEKWHWPKTKGNAL